jgi:NADH-quinone oxidoreductase subunit C
MTDTPSGSPPPEKPEELAPPVETGRPPAENVTPKATDAPMTGEAPSTNEPQTVIEPPKGSAAAAGSAGAPTEEKPAAAAVTKPVTVAAPAAEATAGAKTAETTEPAAESTPAAAVETPAPPAPRPTPPAKPAPPPAAEPAPPAPILAELQQQFGDAVIEAAMVDSRPTFVVDREQMVAFARAIRGRGFDYPACISGVDWADADESKSYREAVYHFRSMATGEWVVLKARCPSSDPWLNSLISVYRGADWNEREIFDMFGIEFRGHPDLRRILMPEDWTGFPLLKSYRMSTYYSPAGNERQK